MGATFSSNQLSGAVTYGNPATSYAYSAGNTARFGVDATYTYEAYGPGDTTNPTGLITPYLVRPSGGATVTCTPFSISSASQSLDCPIAGTALAQGLYTLSFSQYPTTIFTGTDGTVTTSQGATTLTNYGGEVTFSVVPPQTASTISVSVTPTTAATSTITSGESDIAPTTTITVPQTYITVTIFGTTIVSTQTSLTTIPSVSISTVTGTCPITSSSSSSSSSTSTSKPSTSSTSTSSLICYQDNCVRAFQRFSSSASAFCATYTTTVNTGTYFPSFASNCPTSAAALSSGCSCVVPSAKPSTSSPTSSTSKTSTSSSTPVSPTGTNAACTSTSVVIITTVVTSVLTMCPATSTGSGSPTFQRVKDRGLVVYKYAPPDFTYSGTLATVTVTLAPSVVTSTVLSTVTLPAPTTSSGTGVTTISVASTVVVSTVQSTSQSVSVSTLTVSPTNCGNINTAGPTTSPVG